MKKRVYVVASVAGAVLVTGVAVTTALGGNDRRPARSEATKPVSFRGYHAEVPTSWPVYDLSTDPTRCVRFDQHAVYLGTPGPDQKCPAHAVGRTEALLVQPLRQGPSADDSGAEVMHADLADAQVSVTASYAQDPSLARSLLEPAASTTTDQPDATDQPAPSGQPAATGTSGTATASPTGGTVGSSAGTPTSGGTDPAPSTTPDPSPSGTAGPTPSGTDGPSPSATADPTASDSASPTDSPTASDTSSAAPSDSPSPSPSPTPADSPSPTGSTSPSPSSSSSTPPPITEDATTSPSPVPMPFVTPPRRLFNDGAGFDRCEAPSTAAMTAWAPTPLNAVNIYIGGPNRACDNVNLSASWVDTVHGLGYSFVPTYVGLQAPCSSRTNLVKIDPATAATQGAQSADDAATTMRALGFGSGNPVYLDMEAYNGDTSCVTAVRTYTSAFVTRMHALGYAAGFYGSAAAGAQDIAAVYDSSTFARPDALWFARWNDAADLDSEPYVSNDLWPGRRIHQYVGDHDETHGGVTLNIDSDYMRGLIALPGDF